MSNSEACANDGGCPRISEDKSSSVKSRPVRSRTLIRRRESLILRSLSLSQMSAYDRTKNLAFFRDATVTWLSGRFHSTPQSLMLAISLLDRFLGVVSVRIARSRAFSQRFLFLSGQSEIPQVSRCYVLLHRDENDARKQGRRVSFVEPRGRSRFSHAFRKRYPRAYAIASSRRPISTKRRLVLHVKNAWPARTLVFSVALLFRYAFGHLEHACRKMQ